MTVMGTDHNERFNHLPNMVIVISHRQACFPPRHAQSPEGLLETSFEGAAPS